MQYSRDPKITVVEMAEAELYAWHLKRKTEQEDVFLLRLFLKLYFLVSMHQYKNIHFEQVLSITKVRNKEN